MEQELQAIVALPGQGEAIQGPVGGPLNFKARGKQTGGRVTVLENVIPSGEGPPLHLHHAQDEMWFLIEGALRFRVGDDISHAPKESFVFVPRGTPHCFQNTGQEAARILVLFVPAGMEDFFDRFSELSRAEVNPEAFGSLGADSGMEVLGPPLAVSHPM